MAAPSFTVSLRIWHPTYSSQTIAQAIGLQPKFSQSVGELRTNPAGKSLEGASKETYCSFPLKEKTPGYFIDGISDLLPGLIGSKNYFQELKVSGGRLELFIGVFADESSGFTLDTDGMLALAALNLALSVEFYF